MATTTTYGLNKPTVGGDENTWGQLTNDNWDDVDDLLDGTTPITPNLGAGWEVGGVAVTATAAELNILDGVTASTAEINTLDGVTATAAELNILDGVAASTSQINSFLQLTGKNLIINGSGRINQRGYVSGAATSGSNEYTLDRWRVVTSGQSLVFTGTNAGRVMTAPAGGVEQIIEGANIVGGTYVISWTGTATCTVDGISRSSGDTFTLTANTNATVRMIDGTFSDLQVELGTIPTPFERIHVSVELGLCQRYYQKIVASGGGTSTAALAVYAEFVSFLTEMRATPTVSFDGGSVANLTISTADNASVSGARIINTATASGQWNYLGRILVANAEF